MTSKLPPLGSLLAFVAAAKHESFTKAASELFVTQGAISKQIGLLEDHLGLPLFERKHQSLVLSESARTYFLEVSEAFRILKEATNQITKKDSKKTLNISILPSLSSQWLIALMNDFHPLYDINIEVSSRSGYDPSNFSNGVVDAAIIISKKDKKWKGCHVENFIEEKLLCVCSPSYLKKFPIKNVNDLAKHSLLNNTSRPLMWRDYLKSAGLKKLDIKHEIGFEHFFMLIDAAKNGAGIAMIPDFIVKKDLEIDQLIIAFEPYFKSGYAYQLVYPKQKAHYKKIADFSKWVKEKICN